MQKITFGYLKKLVESETLPEDTEIKFEYRENIMSDKGKDYLYTPTAIHFFGTEGKSEKTIVLVSMFPPEIS